MSKVKAFTLDGMVNAAEKATETIVLGELEPNHALVVVTQDKTEYDIIVLEPRIGRVVVKGGQFTEPTECKLTGSTMGGSATSMLLTNRIVPGMRMEFWVKEHCVVATDFVKTIGWRINRPISVSNPTLVH